MRGTRSAAYVFIADEDYSAVVSLVLSVIVRRGRRRPVVAPLVSYHDASVAAARADLASARSGQDVMAAAIVQRIRSAWTAL